MAKVMTFANSAPTSPNTASATKMKLVALEQAFINDRPTAYTASRCECVNAEKRSRENDKIQTRKIDYVKKLAESFFE